MKRGVSTVGPHRDEVGLTIAGCRRAPHASQGEQRTLALSLRLAAHRLVADRTGSTPVLVLDDVLSELDAGPGHRPARPPAARSGRDHDGVGGAGRRRAPDRVLRVVAGARRRRRRAGASVVEAVRVVSADDPVPVTDALDGLLRSLRGGAGRAEVGGVFGRWEEAVGSMIAANVQPVRLEHGTLLVEVDEPAWATQVRFLADDIRTQAARGSRASRCPRRGAGATRGSRPLTVRAMVRGSWTATGFRCGGVVR